MSVVAYENLVNDLTGQWIRNNNPDIPMSVQQRFRKTSSSAARL